jgi:DegV family protein with EDD domain
MSNKVAIVTDSTACIPQDLASQLGIEVVPSIFIFGDQSFRDGVDMTTSEFYTRLRKSTKLPTTSGSLPLAYLEAYRKVGRKANNIVCITISSELSGMASSALIAKRMAETSLPDVKIEIIDSGTAAGAQGLVVLAAARAARAGKNFMEVIGQTKAVMQKVYLFAMLDTLNYLVKGGRAPKAAAIASSILKIKPIFTINSGKATPVAKIRTTQRALVHMVKILENKMVKGLPLHVMVMHADAKENARTLANQIQEKITPQEIRLCEFTPVMGVHTGPGLVGVAFYSGE